MTLAVVPTHAVIVVHQAIDRQFGSIIAGHGSLTIVET